jgi:S1-C subfamily serine protease
MKSFITAVLTCVCAIAQTAVPTSVDAKLVLDAAGPQQRKSLTAIYLIACPDVGFGSGFLLDNGTVVTNSHVVSTCTEKTLFGISTSNKRITFSRVIKDTNRDLALLVPAENLGSGLKLAVADNPAPPGTSVTTWGYPFGYNGTSPLLSVGYVSGFREAPAVDSKARATKHIIVNGAFNHGNSGGPLLIAQDNQVIGIVVLTYNFYPAGLKRLIDQLSHEESGMQWTFTQPDGKTKNVSEAQITAAILDEFYQKTQVMIGEAVAATELVAMLKEHTAELPAGNVPSTKAPARK